MPVKDLVGPLERLVGSRVESIQVRRCVKEGGNGERRREGGKEGRKGGREGVREEEKGGREEERE